MSQAVERVFPAVHSGQSAAPAAEAADSVVVQSAPVVLEMSPHRTLTISALGCLVLAVFVTLYFAQSLFIPIVLATLISLLLAPIVGRLADTGVPEGIGAALVVFALVGSVGLAGYTLGGSAMSWMESAPDTFERVQRKLRPVQKTVEDVKKATDQVQELTTVTASPTVREVVVKPPSLTDNVMNTMSRFGASLLATLVLLYFMLASGNLFLVKLVRVMPSLRHKKRAVEIARRIQDNISAYLGMVTLINAGVGTVTGIALYLVGMPNPILWGVFAAVLRFIPFLGTIIIISVFGLVAAVTFEELGQIVVPPLIYLVITVLESQFVTPIVLGRRLTLNPVAIILSMLIWGWLWGIPGALLAVPLLATFKIVCDNIDGLHGVGEFLGRRESLPAT